MKFSSRARGNEMKASLLLAEEAGSALSRVFFAPHRILVTTLLIAYCLLNSHSHMGIYCLVLVISSEFTFIYSYCASRVFISFYIYR